MSAFILLGLMQLAHSTKVRVVNSLEAVGAGLSVFSLIIQVNWSTRPYKNQALWAYNSA
ncbi:hypothetical protein NIES4103_67710 [Nostoc sp. NIES-4103]|nr:hypothetical protein NIES4103_67710 [Nostoc sp. NIES-4103]